MSLKKFCFKYRTNPIETDDFYHKIDNFNQKDNKFIPNKTVINLAPLEYEKVKQEEDDSSSDEESLKITFQNDEEVNEETEKQSYLPACFPNLYSKREVYLFCIKNDSCMFKTWTLIRKGAYKIAENKFFESFVILMIVLSSVELVN